MTRSRVAPCLLALSLVAAAALQSSASAAPSFPDDPSRTCLAWDLTRAGLQTPGWQVNGFRLWLTFRQHADRVEGYAISSPRRNKREWAQEGRFSGTLRGDTVRFIVDWTEAGRAQGRGFYVGQIDSFGLIHGFTYMVGNPATRTAWTTTTPVRCLKRAVAGPPIATPAPLADPTATTVPRRSGGASAISIFR